MRNRKVVAGLVFGLCATNAGATVRVSLMQSGVETPWFEVADGAAIAIDGLTPVNGNHAATHLRS